MTKRYLWTIVSAALCLSVNPTGAVAAKAPDDWVCRDRAKNIGECDDIRVREPVPTPPSGQPDDVTKVRHLAKHARFSIVPGVGRNKFLVEFKSEEWHAAFLSASPLTWEAGDGELLPEDYCKPTKMAELLAWQVRAKAARKDKPQANVADYSHFYSSPIKVHLDEHDWTKAEEHVWYIYPVEDTKQDGSHVYCLSFLRLDGGSHDGAVHGDS